MPDEIFKFVLDIPDVALYKTKEEITKALVKGTLAAISDDFRRPQKPIRPTGEVSCFFEGPGDNSSNRLPPSHR